MYSRNTSRRSGYTRVNSQNMQKREEGVKTNPDIEKTPQDSVEYNNNSLENNNRSDSVRNKNMPIAPPNYRGMIYDMEKLEENAEGIDRLVKNDQSYTDNQNKYKDRFNARSRENGPRQVFSHMQGIQGVQENTESNCHKDEHKGIKSLVESMQNNVISPEDILICALILLMLSGSSEDDIIMILVLMALL